MQRLKVRSVPSLAVAPLPLMLAISHVASCHHTTRVPVQQMLTQQLSEDKAPYRGKAKCLQVER